MSTDKHPDLPSMGPTMAPPSSTAKAADPFFVIGADDRPLDARTVAISLALRAEVKVGDREFSCPVSLHEVVVLRHFYENRSGSANLRLAASWPPALMRERAMTHQELSDEVKRMSRTYVIVQKEGRVLRSFDAFFGSEPTEQLRRLHAVMREQYEAWRALVAVAIKRLPADTAKLHPEVRLSLAFDLITDRELEAIAMLADPAHKGLNALELPAIDLAPAPVLDAPVVSIEDVKAQAEAQADAEAVLDPTTAALERMLKAGIDSKLAFEVSAIARDVGITEVKDADLSKILGPNKAKIAQVRALLMTTAG